MKLQVPRQESLQLELVNQLEVLDYDFANNILSQLYILRYYFRTPVAFLTIMDKEKQYFISKVGSGIQTINEDEICLSYYTLSDETPIIVENISKNHSHIGDQMIIGLPNIKFFASKPISIPTVKDSTVDKIQSSVVICDDKSRTFKNGEKKLLEHFANVIAKILTQIYYPDCNITKNEKDWLSICSWCRDLTDDQKYIKKLIEIFEPYYNITHGICIDCHEELQGDITN